MSNLEHTRFLAAIGQNVPRPGCVTLVGAGPGDPELLTVKAARAIAAARVVLYDHLVSQAVLDLIPAGADRIDVGKESAHHTLPQTAIIELMLRLAQSGRPVLRLKGGDPYVFGRGGEEAEALAAAGVPFEVIPGISAAQGAAAAAGIPLTHRDHAARVVWVTGHLRAGAPDALDLDWASLARPGQTIAVYMGIATLPGQRTLVGTLQSLPALVQQSDVQSPALILIGSVVSLHAVLGRGAQPSTAALPEAAEPALAAAC